MENKRKDKNWKIDPRGLTCDWWVQKAEKSERVAERSINELAIENFLQL